MRPSIQLLSCIRKSPWWRWLWWIASRTYHELHRCPWWAKTLTWYVPVSKVPFLFSLHIFNGTGLHRTATARFLALLLWEWYPDPSQVKIYVTLWICEHNVDYGSKSIFVLTVSCGSISLVPVCPLLCILNWTLKSFCYKCHTHKCDTYYAYEESVHTSNNSYVLMSTPAEDVLSHPCLMVPTPWVTHVTHSLLLLFFCSYSLTL